MPTKTITVRVPQEKVSALDSVAALQQRDRSFIINEAVDQYLSLYDYHTRLIEDGLRQVDEGDVVDHEEVVKIAAKWSEDAKKMKR
jgi:predicted transcriptional regulator